MEKDVIACTLVAADLKERMAWIAALNGRSLRAFHRDELTLILDYDPGAIEDVRKMVAGEEKCCAFLSFDIAEHADAVRVTIVAPETTRGSAEALFEAWCVRASNESN
jgi:hypothetical protein